MSTISKSAKIVPTTIEYVDIAGLVKGASKGEGLGNKFLSNIRECDSIVQMVRCFEDDDVHHVAGKIDAVADIDVINFELALADVAQIERRLERLQKGRVKTKEEETRNQARLPHYLSSLHACLRRKSPGTKAMLLPAADRAGRADAHHGGARGGPGGAHGRAERGGGGGCARPAAAHAQAAHLRGQRGGE